MITGVQTGQPFDEQLTYLFALVDCIPWVDEGTVEFWLDQVEFHMRGISGQRRDMLVRRIWECVSGEMGGERGLKAVAWWVNGGKTRVIGPKL